MEQQDLMCQADSLSGVQIIPRLEDLLPGLHLFIVLDCLGFEFQLGKEIFLFLQNVQTSSGAQLVPYSGANGVSFPGEWGGGAKRKEREFNRSLPHSAKVTNEWL